MRLPYNQKFFDDAGCCDPAGFKLWDTGAGIGGVKKSVGETGIYGKSYETEWD